MKTHRLHVIVSNDIYKALRMEAAQTDSTLQMILVTLINRYVEEKKSIKLNELKIE